MAGESVILREFLVAIGFSVNEEEFSKLQRALKNTTVAVGAVGAATAAVGALVERNVTQIANQYEKLYYASQRTGASVKNIQALQFGARQVGIEGEQATNALENMARAVRLNPGLNGLLGQFGISTQNRDQVDVMLDLVTKLKQLPDYQGAQYGNMFGIDPDTLKMMEQGLDKLKKAREERRKMFAEAGLNPDQLAADSMRFSNDMVRLHTSIDLLRALVAERFMPGIDLLVKGFEKITSGVSRLDRATGGASTYALGAGAVVGGTASAILGKKALERLGPVLGRWLGLTGAATGAGAGAAAGGAAAAGAGAAAGGAGAAAGAGGTAAAEAALAELGFGGAAAGGAAVAAEGAAGIGVAGAAAAALPVVIAILAALGLGWFISRKDLLGKLERGWEGLDLGGTIGHAKETLGEAKETVKSWGSELSAEAKASMAALGKAIPLHNPGNLRLWGSNPVVSRGRSGNFASFGSDAEGLIAMAGQLSLYNRRDRIDTINGILNKYAPKKENNTAAYIDDVSKRTGFAAGQHLNLQDPEILSRLMAAMIRHEQGFNPFSDEALRTAAKYRLESEALRKAEQYRLGSETAKGAGSQVTIHQENKITVHGANDPHTTAREVGNNQERVNSDLLHNFRAKVH